MIREGGGKLYIKTPGMLTTKNFQSTKQPIWSLLSSDYIWQKQ